MFGSKQDLHIRTKSLQWMVGPRPVNEPLWLKGVGFHVRQGPQRPPCTGSRPPTGV